MCAQQMLVGFCTLFLAVGSVTAEFDRKPVKNCRFFLCLDFRFLRRHLFVQGLEGMKPDQSQLRFRFDTVCSIGRQHSHRTFMTFLTEPFLK